MPWCLGGVVVLTIVLFSIGAIDMPTANALTTAMQDISSAMQENSSVNRELIVELRIRRGVGERGSSYTPTPVVSGQESPAEAKGSISVTGLSLRQNPAKRYAELFRACLKKHNSDCDLKYNHKFCTLKKGLTAEYTFLFDQKSVKNAYALFRLQCENNLMRFLKYLAENDDVVPEFDGETPSGTPERR